VYSIKRSDGSDGPFDAYDGLNSRFDGSASMARRIPSDIDVRIIGAYLLGMGRDGTVKAYPVSGGHVSAI